MAITAPGTASSSGTAFWADKQGIYRASYLLVWKDYPKINTVSQAVSQHGKDSYIRDVLNLYAK